MLGDHAPADLPVEAEAARVGVVELGQPGGVGLRHRAAVEKKYGFDLPDANVAVLDFGLVYTSVAARKPCNFAVVFGTDAQVLANKLVVLQDDKQALATYNVAVSMRTPVYQAHAAQFEAIFGAIAKQLTTQRATELNAKVDIDGEAPEDVAKEFLTQAGIIGS